MKGQRAQHSINKTADLPWHLQTKRQHYLDLWAVLYFAVGWTSVWSFSVFSAAGEAVCLSSGQRSEIREGYQWKNQPGDENWMHLMRTVSWGDGWPVLPKWYSGGNLRHSACFLKVSNSDGSSAPVRASKGQPWNRRGGLGWWEKEAARERQKLCIFTKSAVEEREKPY